MACSTWRIAIDGIEDVRRPSMRMADVMKRLDVRKQSLPELTNLVIKFNLRTHNWKTRSFDILKDGSTTLRKEEVLFVKRPVAGETLRIAVVKKHSVEKDALVGEGSLDAASFVQGRRMCVSISRNGQSAGVIFLNLSPSLPFLGHAGSQDLDERTCWRTSTEASHSEVSEFSTWTSCSEALHGSGSPCIWKRGHTPPTECTGSPVHSVWSGQSKATSTACPWNENSRITEEEVQEQHQDQRGEHKDHPTLMEHLRRLHDEEQVSKVLGQWGNESPKAQARNRRMARKLMQATQPSPATQATLASQDAKIPRQISLVTTKFRNWYHSGADPNTNLCGGCLNGVLAFVLRLL